MILVYGTVCLDRILRVPSLPGPGGYVEVESEALMLGGEAANTANLLAVWGNDVLLVGNALGSGPEGERLAEMLREKGLPAYAAAAGGTAPVCDVYVTPDAERTMFGRGFSRMAPPPLPPYRAGEWFTAEPNLGDAAREAARGALAAGMRVYLMDFIRDDDPVAPGSFWQSSTDWVGHRRDAGQNIRWVRDFVERKGCFAVLTDGPNGLVAGWPEIPVRAYPPYPAVAMVDTTGAGDAFRAGMLHGLERGWDRLRCLAFASAAGSLSCRSQGGTGDVPSVAEVEAHLLNHPEISGEYEG